MPKDSKVSMDELLGDWNLGSHGHLFRQTPTDGHSVMPNLLLLLH
jgi:hypothetical protein